MTSQLGINVKTAELSEAYVRASEILVALEQDKRLSCLPSVIEWLSSDDLKLQFYCRRIVRGFVLKLLCSQQEEALLLANFTHGLCNKNEIQNLEMLRDLFSNCSISKETSAHPKLIAFRQKLVTLWASVYHQVADYALACSSDLYRGTFLHLNRKVLKFSNDCLFGSETLLKFLVPEISSTSLVQILKSFLCPGTDVRLTLDPIRRMFHCIPAAPSSTFIQSRTETIAEKDKLCLSLWIFCCLKSVEVADTGAAQATPGSAEVLAFVDENLRNLACQTFDHQDDHLMMGLLQLVHLNQRVRLVETRQLCPYRNFFYFVRSISPSVLLDLICGPETCALETCLIYCKFFAFDWSHFLSACSFEDERLCESKSPAGVAERISLVDYSSSEESGDTEIDKANSPEIRVVCGGNKNAELCEEICLTSENTLDRVMTLLIRLRLKLQQLESKNLLQFPVKPLLRAVESCEENFESS